MYATVRSYSTGPDLADALAASEDEVKSLISGIDGFEAYYFIRTADGAVSVSVYESEASARESNAVAAGWISENLPELASATPTIAGGEVVIAA